MSTESYKLTSLQFVGGTNPLSQATVCINCKGYLKLDSGIENSGNIIEVVFNIIKKMIGINADIQQSGVRFVNGTENKYEFSVTLVHDKTLFYGKGFDYDIVTAAALAYIDGLNKVEAGVQGNQKEESLLEL
jgi:2-isopropylmalate synthase